MHNWLVKARDSLNIREWRDTAYRLAGDRDLAGALIPLARKLLGGVGNQARLSSVGYMQRGIRLPDGSLIRVIANGALRIIEIDVRAADGSIKTLAWRFFVETGWVHLSEINCMDEIDKAAGLLTVTDDMEAWVHDAETPYVDWLVTDGFINTRDYQNGMESLSLPRFVYETEEERAQNTFQLTDLERMMGEKSVMARKYLIGCGFEVDIQYPASCGGKLKYLFQSVLGRDKPTASVIELVGQPMSGAAGFGLFTTSDWRYYAIRISANSITVQETWQPAEAVVLRAALAEETDFEKRKRLEAYLLSITVVINDSDDLQSISIEDALGIQGESIAYGWHFSWHGHEASIVIQHFDENSDVYANLYTLEFSENPAYDPTKEWSTDNQPILYNLNHEEEDIKWWAAPQLAIWYPAITMPLMFVFNPRYDYGHQEFSFDAPVYCFYDHTIANNETDSKLVVVRAVIELDSQSRPTESTALQQVTDEMLAVRSDDSADFVFEVVTQSDLISFYTVGHHDDIEKSEMTENSAKGELSLGREFNGNLAGPFHDGDTYYYYIGAIVTSHSFVYSKKVIVKNILIIPYNSSESAYVGSHSYERHDGDEELIIKSVHDGIQLVETGEWIHYAPLAWGNPFLFPGGGVGTGTITSTTSAFQTAESILGCEIPHSYGVENVKFREAQTNEWVLSNDTGLPPDIQEWDIFVTPSLVVDRTTDILFHFYNGIGEAAYFTNDISMANVDGHFAWQCVGGLTFDQMGGYFVGWA